MFGNRCGDGRNLVVCRTTGLGGLSLARIRRNSPASAFMGYWMGKQHAGKGYMSSAVKAALDHAFSRLDLDEVKATWLPHNERSIALLEKSGFVKSGYLPDHLEIDGTREDHVLFVCGRKYQVVHNRNPLENAGKTDIPMV